MDRQIIYSGQVPQTLDILNTNKNTMLAIAKMAADVFGTSTIATGLACVPTAPATMSVNVNPGQIYQNVVVDQTAYSDIALDTSHSIVKSGILMDAQNFAITAPGTAGFSQNYLIQATFTETDTANLVLPYYNSANPSQALNGPGGSGSTQPTRRAGQVSLQLLAGTAATTGTQTTPAVTAGYIGLWVVTVANGASSITSGNIAPYPGQPILPSSVLASIQNGNLSYAVATGTANAHTIALTPALTSRVDGMMIRYKAPAANTGAVTLNDGVGTANVLGANHSALQGGEYIANGDAFVVWNSSISGGSYILLECTGGAVQVPPATQSQHAPQMSQVAGVVGAMRNLVMSVLTASATATLTADEIVVESALGGIRYCLPNFSKTINLATTGAGGMDTGSAPVSGFVAMYAIYNPTTGASALLAKNATSAVQPNIYGGGNMPAGYTASALVSVWQTTSGGLLIVGNQFDRTISTAGVTILSTTVAASSYTSFTTTGVPMNAKTCRGYQSITGNTASVGMQSSVASSSTGIGAAGQSATMPTNSSSISTPFPPVPLITPQTLYYQATTSSGTLNYVVGVFEYTI
ncbi:hypothetical protein [Burkholderia cepacia]|uniref:hypothetical protein n=1 Tax=Burkholderia cepacia TaxID=292 RepID=UPI000A7E5929|nr:hypothetical protein [Burkholderia cepacia]